MRTFTKNEFISGSKFVHQYDNINTDDLAAKVNEVLFHHRYKLTEGAPGRGVYVRGNRVLRILFGAFSPYYKYAVMVRPGNANNAILDVDRKTSGMSGGLIGMSQVKSETKRLAQAMSQI